MAVLTQLFNLFPACQMYTIDNACLKLRSIKIKSHPSGKAFESLSGSMLFLFFQITQQMRRSTSSFMSLLNRA